MFPSLPNMYVYGCISMSREFGAERNLNFAMKKSLKCMWPGNILEKIIWALKNDQKLLPLKAKVIEEMRCLESLNFTDSFIKGWCSRSFPPPSHNDRAWVKQWSPGHQNRLLLSSIMSAVTNMIIKNYTQYIYFYNKVSTWKMIGTIDRNIKFTKTVLKNVSLV
jgi:hypothetical protein